MDKQKQYSEIVEFLKSKGASKVAVFGSYVRNEETQDSDIDLIVSLPDDISPYLKNSIRSEMKILYN